MDQAYQGVYLLMLAAFGLTFGSFANVVIHRLPLGESVVHPRSRCPGCEHEIRWYDNLPLLSWAILRGRCRDCGEPISIRYPLVEATAGALWLLAGVEFGFSVQALVAIVFFHLLLILAFIDLDTMRLPNPLVAALFGMGVVFVAISQFDVTAAAPLVGVPDQGVFSEPAFAALLGIALGVTPSLLLALLYGAVRGRAGLGMGDVKLLGAMGPFLGPFVLFAFFGGSILGTIVSIPMMGAARRAGKDSRSVKIPFGPFLALAGVLAVFVGPEALDWYLGMVGIS